jgi:hypothetical protein
MTFDPISRCIRYLRMSVRSCRIGIIASILAIVAA